jgi:hypothetical protein
MYQEQVDQVSEDLIKEIDEKEQEKEYNTSNKKKLKEGAKIVKANKRKDKLKYGNFIYSFIEFKPKLKGINDDDFPDLLKPAPEPVRQPDLAFIQDSNQNEENKSGKDLGILEEEIKKNQELHKKHKLNLNKPENKRIKKKKNTSKMTAKKEEFPGLPGS